MANLHASLHHPTSREWTEPHLHPSSLIYPLFVTNRESTTEIQGFSPNMQWGSGGGTHSFPDLVAHLAPLIAKGLRAVMLFGVVQDKTPTGKMADDANTPVITCLRALTANPITRDLMLCADVCMCEYTDHGHCGVLKTVGPKGEEVIDNEPSCQRLATIACAYAQAGAHCVCPSDMMDGRIGAIRQGLNAVGYSHVSIMAYTSKKASCMYSPFRAAVESSFKGNRKRYQQPVGASGLGMRALKRDIAEGADYVLVKPALFYSDIIKTFAQQAERPVACYIVSGEYKMLKDYGENCGCLENVVKESHVSMMRAGASILITYFTPQILEWLPKW
jgi:porphobilinogen synthase|tara:strand:- start:58 stop:1056 length:999 start_codon:yes stop_codon:yes gene_type:complete